MPSVVAEHTTSDGRLVMKTSQRWWRASFYGFYGLVFAFIGLMFLTFVPGTGYTVAGVALLTIPVIGAAALIYRALTMSVTVDRYGLMVRNQIFVHVIPWADVAWISPGFALGGLETGWKVIVGRRSGRRPIAIEAFTFLSLPPRSSRDAEFDAYQCAERIATIAPPGLLPPGAGGGSRHRDPFTLWWTPMPRPPSNR